MHCWLLLLLFSLLVIVVKLLWMGGAGRSAAAAAASILSDDGAVCMQGKARPGAVAVVHIQLVQGMAQHIKLRAADDWCLERVCVQVRPSSDERGGQSVGTVREESRVVL